MLDLMLKMNWNSLFQITSNMKACHAADLKQATSIFSQPSGEKQRIFFSLIFTVAVVTMAGRVWRGKSGVADYYEALFNAFPEVQFETLELLVRFPFLFNFSSLLDNGPSIRSFSTARATGSRTGSLGQWSSQGPVATLQAKW